MTGPVGAPRCRSHRAGRRDSAGPWLVAGLAEALSCWPALAGAAAPENLRRFLFSPEVGRGIDGPAAGRSVTPADVEAVHRFGRGTLAIERFVLRPGDGCPGIAWLEFSVRLEGGY